MLENAPPEFLARVAQRLKVLADENRIRILLRLRKGECNVGTLSAELGIAQPSVSKHLALLRRAGLVQARAAGAQSLVSVKDEAIFDLCRLVCDGVVRHLREEHEALRLPPAKRRRGA